MRIRTKLQGLTAITAAGLITILLLVLFGLNAIGEATEAARRRDAYIADILEVKAAALSTIQLDPASAETQVIFAAADKVIAGHGDAAVKAIRRTEIRDELKAVLALWARYRQESDGLLKLAASDPKSASAQVMKVYQRDFKPLQADLERFIDARLVDAKAARDKAQAISSQTFWWLATLITIIAVVNLGAVMAISHTLRRTIGAMREQIVPLERGDLTRRIAVPGNDELTEIAGDINSFVGQLQDIVRRTREMSERLAKAAQRLATDAEHVRQSSAGQSDATSSVAAAVEEFSVSIDQVSDNATQAEQKATESGELARSGEKEVGSAISEIRHIEQVVNNATQQMTELGEQARSIGSIINVIKEVADQTNLLALNAAIEAARAGESGRGFAVVADEVRKLAERTTTSAQEITTMVAAVQQHTEQAAQTMREGNALVTTGVEQAEQAGRSMQQINGGSVEVIGAISDISSALREQRTAGMEIAKNIERIAQMTEKDRNVAADVAASAERLRELADSLQAEVAKFSV
jgi:methyl-accepting chemotaxis protein